VKKLDIFGSGAFGLHKNKAPVASVLLSYTCTAIDACRFGVLCELAYKLSLWMHLNHTIVFKCAEHLWHAVLNFSDHLRDPSFHSKAIVSGILILFTIALCVSGLLDSWRYYHLWKYRSHQITLQVRFP
jgi:hypothetical protein